MDHRTSPLYPLLWQYTGPVTTSHSDLPLLSWLPATKVVKSRPSSPPGTCHFPCVFWSDFRITWSPNSNGGLMSCGQEKQKLCLFQMTAKVSANVPYMVLLFTMGCWFQTSLVSQEMETSHVIPGLFKITQSTVITHIWGSEVIKEKSHWFWAPQLSQSSKALIVMCFLVLFMLRRLFHLFF